MTGRNRRRAPGALASVRRAVLVSLVALLTTATAAACDGRGPGASAAAVRVVTTTTVFADLVARVGGPDVAVESLVPPGGEVHTFDPSPGDITALAGADLVVVNGLGLDDPLAELARATDGDAPLVVLGEDLDGVAYLAGDHEDELVNPHLWLNVAYAQRYVERIAEALGRVDPPRAEAYRTRAGSYLAELGRLDAEIRESIAALPVEHRKLVSFHEGFPYFAEAYGLEIVGVIVDAPGQDPSAGEIGDLVAAIRSSGARAVFGEAQFSDKLVRTIAEETGARVESRLHSDSLGDPPADSYVGMMRSNATRIVEALR